MARAPTENYVNVTQENAGILWWTDKEKKTDHGWEKVGKMHKVSGENLIASD